MKTTFAVLLALMPLASLNAQAAPVVIADDPTARFQGEGGAIKFDPACKLPTVEAVLESPSCAARLTAGDTAMSIWVTMSTLTRESPGAEPLRYLDRAIEVENHAAAHYLKASLLAFGERLRPDPAAAVRHARYAAENRNPAAMDLLAMLYLKGMGVGQDVAQAEAWMSRAAASGFGNAAINLALLHLDGHYQPVDREAGLAVLRAASDAGVPKASQLLALATAPAHNYQLEPTPTGEGMGLVDYGMLDNPPIPPSMGFTRDLRALHYAGLSDPTILAELRSRRDSLTANYLFELARRTAPSDPQAGVDLFTLAVARLTVQSQRCGDPSAAQAVPAWFKLYLPDLMWAMREANLAATRAFVARELEAIPPGDPWWLCYGSMTDFAALTDGRPPTSPYKADLDAEAARATALESTDQLLTALEARRQ